MSVIHAYQDLCNQIDFYSCKIRQLKKELASLNRLCPGGIGYKSQSLSGVAIQRTRQISYEDYLRRSAEVKDAIHYYQRHLDVLLENKRELDEKINQYEGLPYQIIYKRLVEHKTHQQIAAELNYSRSYVEKVWRGIVNG